MKSYEEVASRVLSRRDAYLIKTNKRKKTMQRVIPVAASCCLVLLISIGVMIGMGLADKPTHTVQGGTDGEGRTLWSDQRKYNNATVSAGEEGYYVWRWEYRTDTERYPTLSFDGREYTARWYGATVSASLLGEKLGIAVASGYDDYANLPRTTFCTVYGIAGISADRLVAVSFSDSDDYYVYRSSDDEPPATLGALIDAYALTEVLPLTRFRDYTGIFASDTDVFRLTNADSASIWAILEACRDAAYVDDFSALAYDERISFTAASDELGITNKVLIVSKDGYLETNLAEFGYAYYIGEDAAAKIIRYAKQHATKTAEEPTYFLTGTVTEVGDGYLKLDDSIMMKNAEDGVVFTVYLEGLHLTRYIDSGYIDIGNTIRITYDGRVYDGDALTVETVYAIDKAIVSRDGDVWIPE